MDQYYLFIYPKCNLTLSYLATPQFLENACHIGSSVMLILSTYAIFIMTRKSPPAMKSSLPFMLNLHIWTMLCDFMFGVMCLPYYFLPFVAGNPLGIFTLFDTPFEIQIFSAFSALGGMISSLVTIFEQRQRSIVGSSSQYVMSRKSTRFLYYTLLYGYHLNFGLPEVLTMPKNQEALKLEFLELLPCPPPLYFDKYTCILQKDASLFNPHMYFTCFSISTICLFYFCHILWFLHPSNNPSMSPATRKLQRNFFIAMCIQVTIPVCVVLLPNIYWNISITLKFHSQEGNNLSVFFFTLHGISSSLAIIFLYTPYRRYTFNLVKTSGSLSIFAKTSNVVSRDNHNPIVANTRKITTTL